MNIRTQWLSGCMLLVLFFTLCGGPQLLQAQQTGSDASTAQSATPDPSRGPQQPVTNTPETTAPEPPSAQAPSAQPATTSVSSSNPQGNQAPAAPAPQTTQAPAGAAAAQRAETAGGAASKPAGSAIAPAKQHQRRSLLIKVGAIAAAGAAAGLVYGLSRGTPSLPPGARTTATAASGH